jgi:peptide/nickel transport system permease protein
MSARAEARAFGRRLLRALATLLVSSFAIFGALYLAPGSPLAFLTRGRTLSPEALAGLEHQYHLDVPFLERWWLWLTGALHGDLGRSVVTREPVTALLGPRLGISLLLVAMAALLIVGVGVLLALIAGVRGGRTEAGIGVLTTIGLATPSFVVATVLLDLLAVRLGWFPAFGAGHGFADRVWHLALPAVALAVSGVGYVASLSTAAIRVERDSGHADGARSRGLGERAVVRRHVLRNALPPIVTVSGLAIAGLVAGTAVVEKAFEVPGIGAMLVDAVANKDFAVVQAVSLLLVLAFVVTNLVVDVACVALDPRLRRG